MTDTEHSTTSGSNEEEETNLNTEFTCSYEKKCIAQLRSAASSLLTLVENNRT